tara:strand:- start:8700 stop:9512 length:813 start_codon:yes stop_codon:yes gene_type:complete
MNVFWKNTSLLDRYLTNYKFQKNKKVADVVLLGSKSIDLDNFPNLKGIFRVGVGLDNVPVKQAEDRGIKVQITSRNTNEFIFEETANFTCYLIFRMLYSDLGDINSWKVNVRSSAIHLKKLLIIGKGNIGKRVESKMKAFMDVDTFDVIENNHKDLMQKTSAADCISIHIPLTDDNVNFFDKKMLSMMKDDSVLINTSRAAIVSETALYNEIKSGRIRSAFDVFWEKPYNGKLKTFYPQGFFMTPHVASKCENYIRSAAKDFKSFIKELE